MTDHFLLLLSTSLACTTAQFQFNSKSFKIDNDQVIYLHLHVNEPRSNDVHLQPALSQMPPNVFFCFQYFSFPSVHFRPSTWYESLFLFCSMSCWILVAWPRVENLAPLALETLSSNPWTSREVPGVSDTNSVITSMSGCKNWPMSDLWFCWK